MAEIWARTTESFKKRVGELQYNTWLGSAKYLSFENNCLAIEVANKFVRDWVHDNFLGLLEEELSENAGAPCKVKIKAGSSHPPFVQSSPAPTALPSSQKKSVRHDTLNGRYTFDGFVVGPTNQFAHAASLAVANKPGETYSPLFLYGGVGLGKTHLLNAIGLKVLKQNPAARILYTSTEKFMNEFIHAVRFQKMG
ncbi:MAG: DnaA/Hda family protein, partial [archaeon]|nr:DnaA/Hda family protein [archaeon]